MFKPKKKPFFSFYAGGQTQEWVAIGHGPRKAAVAGPALSRRVGINNLPK